MTDKDLVERPAHPASRAMTADVRVRPRRLSDVFHERVGEPARTARWEDWTLNFFFVSAIALPLTAMLLDLDSSFPLEENRALASRPELKFDRGALAQFPSKFEAYFNDQFGLRRRLIHWLNIVKVAGLGVSPSAKVILGKNHWLFYREFDLDYYRVLKPLTPDLVEKWRRGLEARRDWLAARGIPYLVVFARSKSTIYPEYMPPVYNRLHAESRLDQLMAELRAHSSLTVIDLRDPVLKAKALDQVYYRTDSHWNNYGAYAGYTKIMEVLSAWFPQIKAIARSEFTDVKISEPGRDLAMMLAMRKYYWETYTDLKLMRPSLGRQVPQAATAKALVTNGPDLVFEHPDPKLPRAVMFRDSFADLLIPLLSEHFQHIVFSWQYTLDRDVVEREKPDVVIQEMVERELMDDWLFDRPN
jgi:alginate O-acetyltransferase complex protein AlgJ